MRNEKAFLFNKPADFRRGCGENLRIGADGISIDRRRDASGAAVFFSRLLDSRESQMRWHRAVVDSSDLGDASVRFSFFCSDRPHLQVGNESLDLALYLSDASVPPAEKLAACEPFHFRTASNPKDILLHGMEGRYAWFAVELFGQGAESPEIRRIRLSFPERSWIGDLPETYQEDAASKDFLDRFLSVFQAMHEETAARIDAFPRQLDVDVADGPFLAWLGDWLGIEDAFVWSEEKLRELMRRSMRLYRMRGTRQAVAGMVELFTGEMPYLVEQHEIAPFMGDAQTHALLEGLYGDDPYAFTVLVREERLPTTRAYKSLAKVLDGCRPAHMEANLVVLKPCIILDRHSYLGVNSQLGSYRDSSLDGASTIPFIRIAEGPPDRRNGADEDGAAPPGPTAVDDSR